MKVLIGYEVAGAAEIINDVLNCANSRPKNQRGAVPQTEAEMDDLF